MGIKITDKLKVKITKIVEEEFHAEPNFHRIKSRERKYVYPRKALCMLIREYAAYSIMEVAEYMGKKEHTTTLHAINDGTFMLTYDDHFADAYNRADKRVKQLLND